MNSWSPRTWRERPIRQHPDYPDPSQCDAVTDGLSQLPPLVLASEIRALRAALAAVARGETFLLQGGDCAESFAEFHANAIRDQYQLLLEMALVIASAGLPVVSIGRIAGQFAKPRSAATERKDGIELTSYRGDIINGAAFDADARQPDPKRMLSAYYQSAATLNLLRAMAQSSFAGIDALRDRNRRYQDALTPEAADRIDISDGFEAPRLFTSHEALLLPYEEAMTRRDSATGRWYNCSAHMVWIGDRTRAPDGAHVEFCRGIENPLGIKCGPTMTAENLVRLLEALDPFREPGRIVLIARMGAGLEEKLLPLIHAARASGHPVVWSSDPMHGNTISSPSGFKTRDFQAICTELDQFFAVLRNLDVQGAGVHLEMTGKDVTECRGGSQGIDDLDLHRRYQTHCDPRLNGLQAAEIARRIAGLLRGS